MKSIFTRAALLALLAAAALPARAQFDKFPGALKQLEVGYGYSTLTGDYKIRNVTINSQGQATDTSLQQSVSSKAGVTYTFGTSFRLKRLGTKSTFALGVAGMYSGYLWDFPVLSTTSTGGTDFKYGFGGPAFNGLAVTGGVAITGDVKFGVDAMMDKQYRWGWTGGIGVLPSINFTSDANLDAQYNFGVQPVIKTEVALRAGIVMKLRLQAAFGNLTFLDVSSGSEAVGFKTQTQLIGKSNFTVSYILMPFSWMYKKSMWYNSY